VHIEELGKGKNNLVVFPGWKGTIGEWIPVAEKLADKYKIHLVELPGFGESGMPLKNWGIFEYGEFAGKVLDKLGIKKAVIMGHSFGGRVGILLAARTNLVGKLVLIDGAGMEIKDIKTQVQKLLNPLVKFFPEMIKKQFRSSDWETAGELKEILARVVNEPLRDELIKINVPTVIVWGDRDKILSLKEAKMLRDGISNSVLRIVWGAGHWPHLEKFEQFMRILKEEDV